MFEDSLSVRERVARLERENRALKQQLEGALTCLCEWKLVGRSRHRRPRTTERHTHNTQMAGGRTRRAGTVTCCCCSRGWRRRRS